MKSLPILLIAYNFPPLQHSGTIRSEAFAHYLPEYGVQPIVVTAKELHPDLGASVNVQAVNSWSDDPRWGKVHRLDWRSPTVSRLDRTLRRFPVLAGRVRLKRRQQTVESVCHQVARIVEERRPEAIYVSYSPAEAVMLGSWLAEAFSLPAVIDYRDLWSYVSGGPYRHMLDFFGERSHERSLLGSYKKIIVTTQTAGHVMSEKLGVDPSKIEVLPNGYDERNFESDPSISLEPDRFTIVHTGQLVPEMRRGSWKDALKDRFGIDYHPMDVDYGARSPQCFLRAIEELLQRRPSLRDRLRLWFVGVDEPAFRAGTAWFKFPELITTLPRVPSSEAVRIARGANLLLLLQNHYRLDGKGCCVATPAKFYTYLRCKRRILACVQPSEMAQLIREHGVGSVVDPFDINAMSGAIGDEVNRWERREPAEVSVPSEVLQSYDRAQTAHRLARIVTSLT